MDGAILIVDDNPANLALLSFILQQAGHEIRTAPDAETVLELLGSVRPRLILLDLRLPGMDGLTLVRRLRADPATAGLRIVAVTAQAMRGDQEAALAAGCDGFISKPIDTRTIAATVARYLSP